MPRLAFALLASLALPAASTLAGTSSGLLDVSPDGKRLLVVNTDSGTVTVVDAEARKKLCEIPVGDHPEGATWIGRGPLAAVTVHREDKVVFLDADAGKVVRSVKVAAEPYGIVATPDGQRLFVTHDYPGSVSEIDAEKGEVIRTFPAGVFLRGIALAPDGKHLYVTEFYTGKLHAIDRASGKVVDTWSGHSTDNLSRSVVLHPTRPKAYLPHIRARVTHFDSRGSIFPLLSICDLRPAKADASKEEKRRRTAVRMDTFNFVYVVSNPWEAVLSPDGKLLYLVYGATNDMNVCRVVDDDYAEIERISVGRVGTHPRAVRVSPDGATVYVYNTLDYAVGFHDASGRLQGTVKVCEPPHTAEWVRGKVLFQSSDSPMSRDRWVACSSCHPDGQADGRVWQNPEGHRKTPPLFGLAHTHPLHWSADRDEVQDFEYTIRGKLMNGRGLASGSIKPRKDFLTPAEVDEPLGGRSKDLDALAIYTNSFGFRLSPHVPAPGKLSEVAERGKRTFFSKETNCASCHAGPYYSDSSLKRPFNLHDVGTGDGEDEKMGSRYDTPTLLGLWRSAPYLHHGKAATLHEVLTRFNPNDRHGKTSHLKPGEIDELVEFLKSLPYDSPPEVTPNTVPHRVTAPPRPKRGDGGG